MTNTTSSDFVTATSLELKLKLKLKRETLYLTKAFRIPFRVFRKMTTLTIMTILASEALLREKYPVTKCYPQWD